MNKIYLLGDIHGRDFWKELKDNTEDLIIFVGDYVDPYTSYEGITKQQALENFKDIIDFAKSRDNVILLTGNHDMTYFISTLLCECRTDYDNFQEIQNLFRDNQDMFKLAHYFEYNGEKFLITHAGVHAKWYKDHFTENIDPEGVAIQLNEDFDSLKNSTNERIHPMLQALALVSWRRGGWGDYGSCIWADVNEFYDLEHFEDTEKIDAYQIFGHTQLEKGCPYIGKHIACIDAKTIYTIDDILEKRKENENKTNN